MHAASRINALQASRGHAWPTTKVAKQCSSRARALRACLNPPSGPLNLWRRRHLQTLQTVRSICRCGSITRSHMMGSRCLALSVSGQMPSTSALSTSSMWSQSSTTGCTPTHRASMPSTRSRAILSRSRKLWFSSRLKSLCARLPRSSTPSILCQTRRPSYGWTLTWLHRLRRRWTGLSFGTSYSSMTSPTCHSCTP